MAAPLPHMYEFLLWLDPLCIAPYRMLSQPVAGFLSGTGTLALVCVILGLFTLRCARYLHRARLQSYVRDMERYHALGETALALGDKEHFKAVNRQAHEAFGRHFGINGAFFAASLWPVPFALAWMQWRFGSVSPELPFSLPGLGAQPGVVFWFLLWYIPLRMLCGRLLRSRR